MPLLEIVTEPDMHSAEEVRLFAMALRSLLRCLGVNSGDMQKGVLRIEPNISVRPHGSSELGTRTEIKNLNSFRALERSVAYEIKRQVELHRRWRKCHAGDARLGRSSRHHPGPAQQGRGRRRLPLFSRAGLASPGGDPDVVEQVQASLPELPGQKRLTASDDRVCDLSAYDAGVLTAEPRGS